MKRKIEDFLFNSSLKVIQTVIVVVISIISIFLVVGAITLALAVALGPVAILVYGLIEVAKIIKGG